MVNSTIARGGETPVAWRSVCVHVAAGAHNVGGQRESGFTTSVVNSYHGPLDITCELPIVRRVCFLLP